jgi:hypothetical protein
MTDTLAVDRFHELAAVRSEVGKVIVGQASGAPSGEHPDRGLC